MSLEQAVVLAVKETGPPMTDLSTATVTFPFADIIPMV